MDSVHRIFWILKSEILMLKYGETVCCREYLLLCSSVVFGFRNETDAVVDFSFMEIIFVKGLQLTEIVLLRGSAYGDCFVKGFC